MWRENNNVASRCFHRTAQERTDKPILAECATKEAVQCGAPVAEPNSSSECCESPKKSHVRGFHRIPPLTIPFENLIPHLQTNQIQRVWKPSTAQKLSAYRFVVLKWLPVPGMTARLWLECSKLSSCQVRTGTPIILNNLSNLEPASWTTPKQPSKLMLHSHIHLHYTTWLARIHAYILICIENSALAIFASVTFDATTWLLDNLWASWRRLLLLVQWWAAYDIRIRMRGEVLTTHWSLNQAKPSKTTIFVAGYIVNLRICHHLASFATC